jgi:hypothetical protein
MALPFSTADEWSKAGYAPTIRTSINPPENTMRIDWSLQSNLNDEEQRLIRLMRVARALVGALVIGGIAVIAVSSGPFNADSELARGGDPAASGVSDRNLMTLESGVRG